MRIFISLCLCVFTRLLLAQTVIPLYTGKPPGSEHWFWTEAENNSNAWKTRVVYNISEPTLTEYAPPAGRATGTAVVIAPGGGFHALSIDSEGITLAQWLAEKGITAYVLKYRLVRTHGTDPVAEMSTPVRTRAEKDQERDSVIRMATQDGLTAIKYLRQHATRLKIDPNKIGMIGFSAGGTVTMSTIYAASPDEAPDFIAAIYAYTGSIKEHRIPTKTTPIFIAVAADDQLQLMPHSLELFEKWQAAGQPAELHVYQNGGHGFGMRIFGKPSDLWFERFGDWLASMGHCTSTIPDSEWAVRWQKNLREDWSYQKRYQTANQMFWRKKQKRKYTVLMGDSITEGWADHDPAFFTEQNLIGRGISGQTTGQMLLRFRQDVLDLKPQRVVILAGINDIAENTGTYSEDFTFGNIASMCQLAKAQGIEVILASVLPAGAFPWRPHIQEPARAVRSLNNRLKELAKKERYTWLDYHTLMANAQGGLDPDLATDGVHPTAQGYALMKQALTAVLKK